MRPPGGSSGGGSSGRVVLISGGGRGIGAACARHFSSCGDRVVVLARSTAQIEAVAREVGGFALTCDVADAEAVARTVARCEAEVGPVDVLVNNAGVVERCDVAAHSLEAWRRVLDTNLTGPFLMARAVLPAMLERGAGRIINVSSVSGRIGTQRLAAYCASKWGLIGFTKALAEEVKARGIIVTAVCPGSVDTQMLRGSGYAADMDPEDVADAIAYLASAPAATAGSVIDLLG